MSGFDKDRFRMKVISENVKTEMALIKYRAINTGEPLKALRQINAPSNCVPVTSINPNKDGPVVFRAVWRESVY